jgi:hypothetical protein
MAILQPVNEQLGYCFHPSADPHGLGHPQLDVVLRPTPSGEHFDPEALMCLVATANGSARLHVAHPWIQDTTYRVCAGEIAIEDARHEQVKAFTFGGTVQIDTDARRTVCRLASPVPLLQHSQQALALDEHLIEEVTILFAERRAVQDEDDFERRLAAADPLRLYQACLKILNEKFEHFPATDDIQRRFKQFLHSAAQAATENNIPALAELL